MYPFRIRCFQIIKCTRFRGDSVDREYLSVYQILHIEIMRWQTLTSVATIFSPLKIHSQTLTHYNTLFFIRKIRKNIICCITAISKTDFIPDFHWICCQRCQPSNICLPDFRKTDSLSTALALLYWIWQVTHIHTNLTISGIIPYLTYWQLIISYLHLRYPINEKINQHEI